jgi:hypothetical protein
MHRTGDAQPLGQIAPATTLATGEEGPGPTTAATGEETSTNSVAADNPFGSF